MDAKKNNLLFSIKEETTDLISISSLFISSEDIIIKYQILRKPHRRKTFLLFQEKTPQDLY